MSARVVMKVADCLKWGANREIIAKSRHGKSRFWIWVVESFNRSALVLTPGIQFKVVKTFNYPLTTAKPLEIKQANQIFSLELVSL